MRGRASQPVPVLKWQFKLDRREQSEVIPSPAPGHPSDEPAELRFSEFDDR